MHIKREKMFSNVKQVRVLNGQAFIDAFNTRQIMCKFEWAKEYTFFPKDALWKLAQKYTIRYHLIENPLRLVVF